MSTFAADTRIDPQAAEAPVGPRLCIECRHYRMRARPELFSTAEMQSPGGLKALTEWEQQEKQYAEREAQRLLTGAAFTYEPHAYAWCAAYTHRERVDAANSGDHGARQELMASGGAVMDPVSGRLRPIYALCQRMNPEAACARHAPRDDSCA
jgi:hypothetical protein